MLFGMLSQVFNSFFNIRLLRFELHQSYRPHWFQLVINAYAHRLLFSSDSHNSA